VITRLPAGIEPEGKHLSILTNISISGKLNQMFQKPEKVPLAQKSIF